ncbi:hypothetical protein [Salinicola lusitanus]|uniref:hypothetical protein n=1 Tax=Salinicola lusitanus TaxID=1949085 RepID=UPI0013006917|nr:hypothetical protein [Salinicola lusitanus]
MAQARHCDTINPQETGDPLEIGGIGGDIAAETGRRQLGEESAIAPGQRQLGAGPVKACHHCQVQRSKSNYQDEIPIDWVSRLHEHARPSVLKKAKAFMLYREAFVGGFPNIA